MKCFVAVLAVIMSGIFAQQSCGQYYQIDRGCHSCQTNGCSECASHCHHHKFAIFDPFLFYPHDNPPPSHAVEFGVIVNSALDAQIGNGIQAQMVFYHFDFIHEPGIPVQLSPLGIQHLQKMTRISRLGNEYYMSTGEIVVQTTGDPVSDEQRRQAVINAISTTGTPFSADQIVTGHPPVRGISGTEAEKIYTDFLDPSRFQVTRYDSNGTNATNFNLGSASNSEPRGN